MAKVFKILGIIFLSLIISAAGLYFTFLVLTKDAVLDESKLLSSDKIITICDRDGNEITDASLTGRHNSVRIENLQSYTVQAFIASEDRTFFNHGGLNYKRMLKAVYKNLLSRSFKEGASTISQQLIKNTHLSGEKTISRKLNEIRLTKKLEKKYSKEKILEMYLNTIYFGHNCYGLQSAADFYFDKKAEDLTVSESATLVGLLSSPNNYSPFKNPEKSLKRRNLVLKAMLECGYISQNEYLSAKNQEIKTSDKIYSGTSNADYIRAVFDEFEDSGIDFYDLGPNFKIYTNFDPKLQKFIENIQYPCDSAVIITTADGCVSAYKSSIGNACRQPGSTIKPIAVYAPAIEEKLVSPFTKILDEKVDFGGYSPKNNDGKYHGYVTVADSLKMSYNIPAVKTLNALTIEKAEKYLNNSMIELKDGDKNLTLALGGMESGVTIKQLADSYMQFATGSFKQSKFIDKITAADGKIIYKNQSGKIKNFSSGVCSLMNEMLIETTKTGTAKKLKNFDFDIASKTGTCGGEGGNTDAYSVNYTSENCIAVWLGDKNYKSLNITGGSDACNISKMILEEMYSTRTPRPLEKNSGTEKITIDAEEYYGNNKILLCDDESPLLNRLDVKVLAGNIPYLKSTRFINPVIKNPEISVKNDHIIIELCQTKYYSYLIKRKNNGKYEEIYNGKWKNEIIDDPPEGVYEYSVVPYFKGKTKTNFGSELLLPPVKICSENKSPQVKIPDIVNGEWYND